MVTYEQAVMVIENFKGAREYDEMLGLTTLRNAGVEIDFAAGHDIIWCADFEESLPKLGFDEINTLAACGFFEDEGAWAFNC